MSDKMDTKEPTGGIWSVRIFENGSLSIISDVKPGELFSIECPDEEDKANAAHIVACHNVLIGHSTRSLELIAEQYAILTPMGLRIRPGW